MKNFVKLFGIIPFTAIILFSFPGCDVLDDLENNLNYEIGDTGPGGGKIFYKSESKFNGIS